MYMLIIRSILYIILEESVLFFYSRVSTWVIYLHGYMGNSLSRLMSLPFVKSSLLPFDELWSKKWRKYFLRDGAHAHIIPSLLSAMPATHTLNVIQVLSIASVWMRLRYIVRRIPATTTLYQVFS